MKTKVTEKPEKKESRPIQDTRIRNLITNLNDPIMLQSAERVMREQETQGTVEKPEPG